MNTTKPNWQRIGIVLGGLAILAIVVGWGAHFVLDALSNDTATATIIPLTATVSMAITGPTQTPTATLAVTTSPNSMPTPAKLTSTPRPTFTPDPTRNTPGIAVVQPGDRGLYDVCRRYCAGCWEGDDVPSNLLAYAREVAAANNKPWNNGNVYISPRMKLTMPPCPLECP